MYNLPHSLDQFLFQDYKSQESSTQLLDTFLNFTSLLKCIMYQLGLSVAITERLKQVVSINSSSSHRFGMKFTLTGPNCLVGLSLALGSLNFIGSGTTA